MDTLTFISQIFLYFFGSVLAIYGSFADTIFSDTGNAIQQVLESYAHGLLSYEMLMPIFLVLTIGILVMAVYVMLLITTTINSFLE